MILAPLTCPNPHFFAVVADVDVAFRLEMSPVAAVGLVLFPFFE